MKHNSQVFTAFFLLFLTPSFFLWQGTYAQGNFRYKICLDSNDAKNELGGFTYQMPADSGYVTFGKTTIYKLDKVGTLKWYKTYVAIKSGIEYQLDVTDGIVTSDGGLAVVGEKLNAGVVESTYLYPNGNSYIHKTDKNGNTLWAKEYPVGTNGKNRALAIRQLSDSGFMVMGRTYDATYSYFSDFSNPSYDTYLLRLDKNGTKIWCYTYDAQANGEEHPFSLEINADGSFMVGGTWHGGFGSSFLGNGWNQNTALTGYKGWMMNVSNNGQTVTWSRRYGVTNEILEAAWDIFNEVKQTKDGGYIAVGYSDNMDDKNEVNGTAWVVKTSALGVIEWQKKYSAAEFKRVEVVNDGYVLAGREGLVKINGNGEAQWVKTYGSNVGGSAAKDEFVGYSVTYGDIALTMDSGLVINATKYTEVGGLLTFEAASIIKTNQRGEYDDSGCFFNNALSSRVDERVDTLYLLTPKSVNVTPATVQVKEDILPAEACPVVCDISDIPLAPKSISAISACVNTGAHVYINPTWENEKPNYALYKVNFGDPGSGTNNELTGTGMYDYGQVVHNYSEAGSYIITMVVYNGDYSLSDTVTTRIQVVDPPIVTVLTPEIHSCNKDTLVISATVENYSSGYFTRWLDEHPYTSPPATVLSQINNTVVDTRITTFTVVADESVVDYYILSIRNQYSSTCNVYDTIKVIAGDNEAVITGDTKICSGATSTLNVTGGDIYLWSTGATTPAINVNPATSTTYWAEAKTTDGCRDTAFVYVKVVSAISVSVTAGKRQGCVGETVTLYASGAQNYTWSNGGVGDSVKVILANGTNTYVVTGTNGSCTDTASIVIVADALPLNANLTAPAWVCAGSKFTAIASGGSSYDWGTCPTCSNDSIQTFRTVGLVAPSPASEYFVSVAIYNGVCGVIKKATTYYSSVFGVSLSASECRVCPGTQVTISVDSGYIPLFPTYLYANGSGSGGSIDLDYQWSTGQTGPVESINVLVTKDTIVSITTTYSISPGQTCSTTGSIALFAKPYFYIKKESSSTPTCANSPTTLYLLGEPLDDFTWEDGSKNDTLVYQPANDEWFSITATGNGCTRTDSVFVSAKSNLPQATISGNALVCKGAATTYSVSGNAPVTGYKWLSDDSTNPTITIATNKDTVLKAVLTFTLGCSDTATYSIKVKTASTPTVSGNTLICPNGTVVLTASGGYYYQWNNGSTDRKISITTPKDSLLSVIVSSTGCNSDTIAVSISTNKIITATLFSDEDTICSGTALTLIAGGGDEYTWSTGEKGEAIGIVPPGTTTYTVNASTKENCADTANITITVNPSPTLSVSGETSLCSGNSATLQAIGNAGSFLWSNGATTSAITVIPVSDSAYSVMISDGTCSDSVSHAITVVATTSISAGSDQTILQGVEITLTPTGGTDYNWYTVDGVICTHCNTLYDSPNKTTTYYLNETGIICSEDSVTIYVINCANLFVPTAFSPNNDGVNEVLYLKNDCIKQLDFKIYDRWGNKVFESSNVANGWDGTYKGKLMDPAVFVYYVNAILFSGEPLNSKGNISLVR